MKLGSTIEEEIKNEAVDILQVGRTDWDIRHTVCSIKWIKKLIEQEGGDERVLIPAMYFHDTGYEELKMGYSHQECLVAKKNHATRGAENAVSFLPKLNYFTAEEIERIVYLVKNHDIHNNIAEHDRQLVMEADGFAQIDWENCPPSYDKKNCIEFLNTTFEKDRVPYIKTKTGKKVLRDLLEKANNYLKKM